MASSQGQQLPSPATGTLGTLAMTQLNDNIEKLRSKLNDPTLKLSKEVVLVISTELQALYKKLMMSDLDAGVTRQLENFLWNDGFKTPLTHFMKSDKALFHWLIEAGVGFYLGFIQDIGIHFDVPFIKNSVRGMYCTGNKMKPIWKCIPSKVSVYYVIQNSMVHVGDLLRYRASFIEALRMYEKSAAVSPANGHPYNQMGLVQLHIDSKSLDSLLSGIYYYVRAVSVSNPFLPAQGNLDNLLNKVKAVKPVTEKEQFVYDFLLGVGNLDAITMETDSYPTLLKTLIPKKTLPFSQIFRILVIALYAWKREADKGFLGIESTNREYNALEIIAALMNGIVAGMIDATEIIASPYLPILKLSVEWLRLNPQVLEMDSFRGRFNAKPFCELINRFISLEEAFTIAANELNHVILSEEKKLLGFLPLTKAYEHLVSVMNEDDPRGVTLRVIRLLKGVEFLAQPRFGFLERNYMTKEFKEAPRVPSGTTVIRAPSRRNVALQSILNSIEHSQGTSVAAPTSTPTQNCNHKLSMESIASELSSPLATQLVANDLSDFSALFTSIWTPSSRPGSGLAGDKVETDGWN